MTQISNLTANRMPGSAENTVKTQKQDLSVAQQFAGIMNQNAQNLFGNSKGFTLDGKVNTDVTARANQNQPAAAVSNRDVQTMNSAKNRQVETAKPDSKIADVAQNDNGLKQLGEDIQKAVADDLGLSPEDVADAMEVLGLSVLDLLDTQNLVALVQNLTGSETSAELLTNDSFQQLMADVTGLVAEFQKTNDLTPQEFAQVTQTILTADENQPVEKGQTQQVQQPELVNEQPQEQTADVVDAMAVNVDDLTKQTGDATEAVRMDAAQTEPGQRMQTENVSSDSTQEAVTEPVTEETVPVSNPEDSGQATEQDLEQNSSGQSKFSTDDHLENDETVAARETNVVFQSNETVHTQTISTQTQPQNTTGYIDMEQLMNQLDGLARTYVSSDETTIEMQLNPERLGKLFLSVTQKEGVVSAVITASNEDVKEALQTQLVAVRETMQMQGIKIDAVEVTVATHEFEQNLDGNQGANGENQAQQENQARESAERMGRRNLNLNEMDEMMGVMSEEERLVAQMMADQGNSVDFTA